MCWPPRCGGCEAAPAEEPRRPDGGADRRRPAGRPAGQFRPDPQRAPKAEPGPDRGPRDRALRQHRRGRAGGPGRVPRGGAAGQLPSRRSRLAAERQRRARGFPAARTGGPARPRPGRGRGVRAPGAGGGRSRARLRRPQCARLAGRLHPPVRPEARRPMAGGPDDRAAARSLAAGPADRGDGRALSDRTGSGDLVGSAAGAPVARPHRRRRTLRRPRRARSGGLAGAGRPAPGHRRLQRHERAPGLAARREGPDAGRSRP